MDCMDHGDHEHAALAIPGPAAIVTLARQCQTLLEDCREPRFDDQWSRHARLRLDACPAELRAAILGALATLAPGEPGALCATLIYVAPGGYVLPHLPEALHGVAVERAWWIALDTAAAGSVVLQTERRFVRLSGDAGAAAALAPTTWAWISPVAGAERWFLAAARPAQEAPCSR
jgi:hypothetical protein